MKDPYTVFYLIKACALLGRVEQSVTCLTTVPGVRSSIRDCSHSFVEIDHEIVSMVILLPSADFFKKGCRQLQAKVCAQCTGKFFMLFGRLLFFSK